MNKKFLSAVFAAVIALSASSCSYFKKENKAAPQVSENKTVKEETCENSKKCKNHKKENKSAKKAKAVKAEAPKAETKTESKK